MDRNFDPKRDTAHRARWMAGRAALHCRRPDHPASLPGGRADRPGRGSASGVRAGRLPAHQLLPDRQRLCADAGLWRLARRRPDVGRRLLRQAVPAGLARAHHHGAEPGRPRRRGDGDRGRAAGTGMVRLGPALGPAGPGAGLRGSRRLRLERAELVDIGPDRLLPGLPVDPEGSGPAGAVERAGPRRRPVSGRQPADLEPVGLSRLSDADGLRLLPRPAAVLPRHGPGLVRPEGLDRAEAGGLGRDRRGPGAGLRAVFRQTRPDLAGLYLDHHPRGRRHADAAPLEMGGEGRAGLVLDVHHQ